MFYGASSLALAALEVLVHLPPQMRRASALPDVVAVGLDVPDAEIAVLAVNVPDAVAESRALADNWLHSAQGLALAVPSAIIRHERNVLLNPRHAAMARVTVMVQEPFRLDPRLFG